jgi:hypothetical protein
MVLSPILVDAATENRMSDRAATPEPIRILVGYEWQKDARRRILPARSHHKRWGVWRDIAKKECDTLRSSADKRPGSVPFRASVERLRGTHGQFLLGDLIERMRRADILLMDIGSSGPDRLNSNVLLEIGIILGLDPTLAAKSLFVLKPEGLELPSDLVGFLATDYRETNGPLKLVDAPGFRPALRAAIRRYAVERSMIGPPTRGKTETGD